jgi:hypothetical protein
MAKLNEDTELSIPLKNIVGLLVIVSIATAGYFDAIERINSLEHAFEITELAITQNSDFRVKWPRGELGALPADARQDLFIEILQNQIERLEENLERIDDIQVRTKLLEQRLDFDIPLDGEI